MVKKCKTTKAKKGSIMFKPDIIKYYEYKTAWQDWLKYKKPIPKHITPVKFNNLIGGYGTYNKIKKV